MKLSDLAPGKTAVKPLLYVLGAILAGVLVWQVAYRLLYQGQDLAREKGGRVVAEGQVQAEGAIVDGAMGAVREREVYREHVVTTVREAKENIDGAWNGEQVGEGVDAAGAAALCRLHDSLCRRPSAPVQPVR